MGEFEVATGGGIWVAVGGSIALLHLDCDLYESYKLALETFYDKVQPDGVIMFDEYADERWPGARKAIDEFFVHKPEAVQAHAKCDWKYYATKGAIEPGPLSGGKAPA
jgi:hypothetical protein